jgi:DNA-3-methyladenine glycosylase I
VSDGLAPGDDGRLRCWWGTGSPEYEAYHDAEWGRPTTADDRLFEKIVLEGFQAGLAWITILRKRDRFREVFAGFDPTAVALFGERDVERLLRDEGIVRHRGKIEAAVGNARLVPALVDEFGSLAAYFWGWAPAPAPAPTSPRQIPAMTEASSRLSADLKRRGWRFVGPTTAYAFMQAMGLVDDHLAGCAVRDDVEVRRLPVLRGFGRV